MSRSDPRLEEFSAFFEAVHGSEPFPWQKRLLGQVLERGWPAVIDLPTSSGKTACIDIAVFHLALEADRGPLRNAPMRTFFVIDRRVVVDEAFERARKLARALASTDSAPVVQRVAARLGALAGEGQPPLECSILRGGMYRDETWTRSPTQPTVVVSTVDQVGSRLLFRAYGRTSRAWPIHAGLVGHDALHIVDEAHCSGPFLETLEAIQRYRAWAEQPISGPFHVVGMSATLPARSGATFRIGAEDREDRDHPVLGRRLSASKPTRRVSVTGDVKRGALSKALVAEATALANHPRVIGVIVNRVATARETFAELEKKGDAILLTGRTRPHDRVKLLESWREVVFASPERVAPSKPLFVVATQCIEVGANLDFDALVTECASLDALRQRFGRLDRLGRAGSAPGVVLAHVDAVEQEDPIYGRSLGATWSLLGRLEVAGLLDFGVAAMASSLARLEGGSSECVRPLGTAPVFLPAHVDLLCQTSPEPSAAPDPDVLLHGEQSGAPEVRVVWRADLPQGDPDSWSEVVAVLPPTSVEAMPLPLPAVRDWLRERGPGERDRNEDVGSDLETATIPPARPPLNDACPPVLRWRGLEESEVVRTVREIRPGDTLVVPSEYGGCDEYGWFPGPIPGQAHVEDLGELANVLARGRPGLRITSRLLPSDTPKAWRDVTTTKSVPEDVGPGSALDEILTSLAERGDEVIAGLARLLTVEAGRRITVHPAGGLFLTGRPIKDREVLLALAGGREALFASLTADECSTEDDACAACFADVSLDAHSRGVQELAARFGRSVGLDPKLADDIALAGWLHDLGKSDPRFQSWLRGGERVALQSSGLMAKSARLGRTRARIEQARKRSGYPCGGRHELLSVRLAESAAEQLRPQANDWDLVLHLVASHHGFCRPLAPVVVDDDPGRAALDHGGVSMNAATRTRLETMDSGVTDRFWGLVRKYGWWGLAYLEAVLRLADHRRSEREEHEPEGSRKGVRRGRAVAARD